MIIYTTFPYCGDKNNIEKAKEITRELQKKDMANCYVCPLTFLSHIDFDTFDKDDLMELRLDILQNCDKLIVAGEISEKVQIEIDFAKLVGMEIEYLAQ